MARSSDNSTLMMEIGQGLSVILGLARIAYWNTSTRPKKAKAGTFGFNLNTNNLEYYNGSYWLQTSMKKL